MSSSAKSTPLELSAEAALFQGKVRALVATLHANERPLRGLAGLLDWRFRGEISRAIRAGALEGSEGECAYLPLLLSPGPRKDTPRVFHVILFGRGAAETAGARSAPSAAALAGLRKNLLSLKLDPVGLSRADFGHADGQPDQYFANALKGVPLCVVP